MGTHNVNTLARERPLNAPLMMLKKVIMAKLPAVAAFDLASGK